MVFYPPALLPLQEHDALSAVRQFRLCNLQKAAQVDSESLPLWHPISGQSGHSIKKKQKSTISDAWKNPSPTPRLGTGLALNIQNVKEPG